MALNFGNLARYFLLFLSTLMIGVVLYLFSGLLLPMDSFGEVADNCVRVDFPSVQNSTGEVAASHRVDCSYGIAHGGATTFVYVHKRDAIDSRGSLVFSYDNLGNFAPLKLAWDDHSNLRISISEVGEITKQVNSIGDTKIDYSIGRVKFSSKETLSWKIHVAEVLFALLILLSGIFVLSARSPRKSRVVPAENSVRTE